MGDHLYSASLDFIEERGDQIVFGGKVVDDKYRWGETEFGPARPIADTEFVFDRRYWELLGKPDKLIFGFANEEGWDKWVNLGPPSKGAMWLQAFEGGEI